MGQLGDFLEVVYGPAEPFRSVRATIRQRCNSEIAAAANGGDRPMIGRRKLNAPSEDSTPDETSLQVWMNAPQHVRLETQHSNKDPRGRTLFISNGMQDWRIDSSGQVTVTAKDPLRASSRRGANRIEPDLARHFDHGSLREYFVGLALEGFGAVESVGRKCLRLRAVPRPGAQLWSHWLPSGADEYEFHADLQLGVLLYIEARCKGQVFEVNEVLDVHFDEPLDDALFDYTPSASESVVPETPIMERLTLQDAKARVPFQVLMPGALPESVSGAWELMYHPPRKLEGRDNLTLMFRGPCMLWIQQSASENPDHDLLEWEPIDHFGHSMAISDPETDNGLKVLSLERLGTYVEIYSSLPRLQLIQLAASLRVPTSGD